MLRSVAALFTRPHPDGTTENIEPQSPDVIALTRARAQANALVLGKHTQVDLAFVCVLVGGHLLLEDRPGVGKTLLARALSSTMELSMHRLQCTSDLMPSDIVGISVYRPDTGVFDVIKGPVFTNILVADEINRAPARTQSALLEAMAEHRVTIDRTTHVLPDPFLVIATQNPLDMAGTFPLPDAQKDRFLFRTDMGYPDRAAELALMRGTHRPAENIVTPAHRLQVDQIIRLRDQVRTLTVSDALLGYAYDLVQATRTDPRLHSGVSPRASQALVDAARAMAFLAGRTFVRPEDMQQIFVPLTAHRVHAVGQHAGTEVDIMLSILGAHPAP